MRRLIRGLQNLFHKRQVEREMEEELRGYLEASVQARVRAGMTEQNALRASRVEMGSVDAVKEEIRAAGWELAMETLWQDVRFGMRMLWKNPAFTTVAVAILALGMGANAALFSLVNGILLEPLPFAQPERLVSLTDAYPQGALVAMRTLFRSVEVAGYSDGEELNLTGLGDPVRLHGVAVSANFFSLLGTRPELGRVFTPGEDQPGQDRLVILSHALWKQRFGSDPSVVGRVVTLEGESRQIVGVMPPAFQITSSKADFWIPLHLDPRAVGAYWGAGFMPVIGRLRPNATQEQARAELRAHLRQMREMFPWKMPDALWGSSTVIPLQESLVGNSRTKLLLLLGAASMVLLIACTNVANLLLARATSRQKELAVRVALGAGRRRIFQQLLTESLVLAAGGGALGAPVAWGGLMWLKSVLPADTPRLMAVTMDWRVLAFTAAITLLAALVFGTVPALQASRANLAPSLKTAGRSTPATATHRARTLLATAEVALAVVLVTGAGLMMRSLWELSHVDPGFRTESVVTARITPNQGLCTSLPRCQAFYEGLVERARALSGVGEAAAVNALPLDGRINAYAADVEGHPRDPKDPAPILMETIMTPGYFRLMGIPLLRGREFTPADSAFDAPPVAIVTASTARKFWPNQNPIGKHLRRAWINEWTTTVVGVAGDVNQFTLASRLPEFADGAVYVPFGSDARAGVPRPAEMTLAVRTSGNYALSHDDFRRIVSTLDSDVPVSEVRKLGEVVSESASAPRSMALLFGIFAAVALVLGAIGIYGVIAYFVVERTREIGIRMALGASRQDVLRAILRQGMRLMLIGIGTGVAGALVFTRFLSAMLYGVKPTDPLTFIAVSLILAAVVLAASYLPARRATKVDPMVALRYE